MEKAIGRSSEAPPLPERSGSLQLQVRKRNNKATIIHRVITGGCEGRREHFAYEKESSVSKETEVVN